VYVPILAAVVAVRDAVGERSLAALSDPLLLVVLPVIAGVVVGIVVVSNVLKFVLRRYEKPTLGVLMGLLVGAVAGLWPFQEGVAPQPGDRLKNQTVVLAEAGVELGTGETVIVEEGVALLVDKDGRRESVATGLLFKETGRIVEREDFPTAFFQPDLQQAAGSIALIVIGIGLTYSIGRLGREKEKPAPPSTVASH
jgi:putative membrane protein